MAEPVHALVDHLFRHEAGRITAALVRILGAKYLELAEEASQEALVRALQLWPFRGVPENPAAWLHVAARNYVRDVLRREQSWREKEPLLQRFLDARGACAEWEPRLDDTLAMMLLCCHPALPFEGRVAFTLKVVSGFSTREIAAAFLAQEETVAQRIVRAKRILRVHSLPVSMPEGQELEERLDVVCEALYALFNEGYMASHGESALRRDLCEEAVRLLGCILTAGHATPERWALAALFHLHLARFAARQNADGQLREFSEICAASLDAAQLRRADALLLRAMDTDTLSAWHLEAAIASAHCRPIRNWRQIVALYDALLHVKPSPLVRLNRAVAVFRAGRRGEALAELDALEQEKGLRNYSLLPATQARLQEEAGNRIEAKQAYARALSCAMNAPARTFLQRRLENVPD